MGQRRLQSIDAADVTRGLAIRKNSSSNGRIFGSAQLRLPEAWKGDFEPRLIASTFSVIGDGVPG